MRESAVVAQEAVALALRGNTDEALRLLGPKLPEIGSNRDLALAFAQVLAQDPTYPDVLPHAERVVSGFATDPEVVITLSAALLRVAERRPPDEPPFERGPAHLAAAVCQSCFEALTGEQRRDPEVGGYLQINLANALRMMGPDHDDDALKAYQLALTIDDANGSWWFQLGLFYKWRGRFREGLDANRKAVARAGADRGMLWNLAICATALGDGEAALEVWRSMGMPGELSKSGMPYVPDIPAMQVRVATMGEDVGEGDPLPPSAVTFEVLWVQPLSPCHGVVQTPTARRASVDYGDVVLWDGAPVRVSTANDRPVPVFPLLWVLRPGDERRFRFVGMQKDRGLVQELAQELGDDALLAVFDERMGDDQSLFYGKLIVPGGVDLDKVRSTLEASVRKRPGLTLVVPKLYELLGDTPAAGKAHQAWGGIERNARKLGLLPPR
jgi:Flp pilus assembly protein TadD